MTNPTELQTLQQQLADSTARADIECRSIRDDDGWHDLSSVVEEDQECVGRVRFRDHSEQPLEKVAIHDIDACMGMTCDCMDDQGPECDTCGGSGVIASVGPCPECGGAQ